ncbi:MAG: SLATT domain-containing protein [Flavobacteriaceae bacterium]|nr:SLATT domain-containing protein [Flavobacteriaceae bacterium]
MANEEDGKESWDLREWLAKEPKEAITGMYEKTLEFSEEKVSWYLDKIKGKRFVSQTSRVVSFIFLASGTILPLLAGLSDDPGQRLFMTQLGVVSLAVAGLAQVADKAFGWSSGWMRFIKTVTEMEMRTSSFESEWFEYELNKPSLDAEDVLPLFNITKEFRQDLEQMQLVETNGWITEYNAGIAVLETAINSQREKAKKDLKLLRDDYNKKLKESEDALRRGAINLSLT